MTLFSWFGQSNKNNQQHLQIKKPLTLDHKSMWPIAKVEMTTQLINKNKGDSSNELDDYIINSEL